MKKILLIRPAYQETVQEEVLPLGLGYLAAVLRQNGESVRIYDMNILKLQNLDLVKKLENNVERIKLIGISILTWWFYSVKDLCHLIKNNPKLKRIPIVLGGYHPTFLTEYTLRETGADFAVMGEGELTIVDLVNCINYNLDLRLVKGLGYFQNGTFVTNAPRPFINDLDSLPMPAWDLIRPKMYRNVALGVVSKALPVFPIITSRGCPFNCIYCSSVGFWSRRVRYHSAKRVVDEIEFLIKNHGAREICILDDNFTVNKKRIWKIAYELKKRKINIPLHCGSGVKINTFDERLLKLLRTMGFYQQTFAIESGSPRILKIIHKDVDLKKAPEIINQARKMGYFVRALFMMGLPGESMKDVFRSIQYASKLNINMFTFSIFQPFPGCDFYYKWIKDKDEKKINWNMDLFKNEPDMQGFNSIPPGSLIKLRRYLYFRIFFSKPHLALKYLLTIKLKAYPILVNRFIGAFLSKK